MAQELSQLVQAIRTRSDTQNSNIVTDDEIYAYVNQAVKDAYDLVCSVNESFFVTSTTFTLSSSNVQTLPADFYKMRGLDYQPSAQFPTTVHAFNFAERNKVGIRSYRLLGDTIEVLPKSNFAGTYQLWYVPSPPELALEDDTLGPALSHWDEYVIVWCAIKVLQKQQDPDVSALLPDLAAQKERILTAAATRDSEPEQIPDVRTCDYFSDPFFRN